VPILTGDNRHQLPYRLSLTVHGRRLAVRSGVTHVDHGNQFISIRFGKESFQQGRVKGADPEGGQTFILGGEHQVGGDDGGIDLGAVLAVVAADPGIGGAVTDHQDQWRPVVRAGNTLDGLQRIWMGKRPDMNRLLVHRRRRNPTGFQDPFDLPRLNFLCRKGTAGIPVLNNGIEIHRKRYANSRCLPLPTVPKARPCTPAAPCHSPGFSGCATDPLGY